MNISKFMENGPTDENLSHFLLICEHFISSLNKEIQKNGAQQTMM